MEIEKVLWSLGAYGIRPICLREVSATTGKSRHVETSFEKRGQSVGLLVLFAVDKDGSRDFRERKSRIRWGQRRIYHVTVAHSDDVLLRCRSK